MVYFITGDLKQDYPHDSLQSRNYRLNGENVLSAALDIVGVVDPTGAA